MRPPIDISRTISPSATTLPGDASCVHEPLCDIDETSPCKITSLRNWTTHFLTHVDPPRHFIPDGATLDMLPLARFITAAIVVEVNGPVVSADSVPNTDLIGTSVLFKTANSLLADDAPFSPTYTYLSSDAAALLAMRRANLVGIDYLTIDRYGDSEFPAHRALLAANVLILEGLSLAHVPEGRYSLVCMPLKIKNADGSPVRAILLPEEVVR